MQFIKGVILKKRLILLLSMLPALVMCTTRTVSLDGTQQYTTIQSAVDVSIHGDSILVYPGRYVENINLIRQSISIASLYSLDPQQSYMDNTIIDGNLGTCVRVINGETITLNGFTLVNNENGYYGSPINPGGGVDVRNYSSAIVSNCIIRDCIAQSGGGIGVGSHSNLSLSNVKILDNQALRLGGGIAFDESVTLFFDPVALCSVYNNTATIGMDISLSFHYETQNSYNVHLLRGSSVLSEPDGYFVGVRNCNVTLDIQEGYITQIDSDLYVSPNGDDANTGLSAESPMQSIVYAMQRIASNSANHRTIHLAEGIYSNSNNNQLFPAGVKSHVRVIGAGMDDTVLDCEFLRTAWGAWYANDIEIANMKIVNCRSSYTFPLGVYYGSDIYLHDLKFENNWGANFSAMTIGYCDNIIIENIIAGYTTYDNDLMTLGAFDCDNLLVSNFISANN